MNISSPYFKSAPGVGSLELEEILVEYDYPLLFVLTNGDGQRFLCMCYGVSGNRRNSVQDWIMTPVSVGQLKSLLQDEITLDAPFKASGEKTLIRWRRTGRREREVFTRLNAELVPESCLPIAGEYLEAEPDEWSEYIARLEEATRRG